MKTWIDIKMLKCKCGLMLSSLCVGRVATVDGHLDSIIQGSNSLAAAVGFWIYPWTTKIQTYVSIVHEEALTLQDAKYSN